MISVARRRARKTGSHRVSFEQGDVNALPFRDRSFDGVIAAGLFPNLNQPAPALRELCRVLRDDGRLVVLEFDRDSMTARGKLVFRTMIFGYRLMALSLMAILFLAYTPRSMPS